MRTVTFVTELCPGCFREVTLIWKPKLDGLKAYCPHCGKVLMLCSECPGTSEKGDFDCDYDSDTETCSVEKAVNRIH